MRESHLSSLERKHAELEKKLHEELQHPARDEVSIRRWKEQKLHLREEIEQLRHQSRERAG